MKKLFTLLATMAVALSLTAPVYAKGKRTGKGASASEEHGQAHGKHAKTKKGKGKMEGQEGAARGQEKK